MKPFSRRTLLQLAAGLPVAAALPAIAQVADRLRAVGHQVYTPSFTGMGDRAHLLNPNITLVKSQQGWNWIDIAAPHEAHITHPELLTEVLLKLS